MEELNPYGGGAQSPPNIQIGGDDYSIESKHTNFVPADGDGYYTNMTEKMIQDKTIEQVGFEQPGKFNKAFQQFKDFKPVIINDAPLISTLSKFDKVYDLEP